MTTRTSELAANALARWTGTGKPVALWLDCDTGHDVRFQHSISPVKLYWSVDTDMLKGCIRNSSFRPMSGFEIFGYQHYLWQRSSGQDDAKH
jgi:hypothetical protein